MLSRWSWKTERKNSFCLVMEEDRCVGRRYQTGSSDGLVDMIPIIVSPILLVQKPPELVIGEDQGIVASAVTRGK